VTVIAVGATCAVFLPVHTHVRRISVSTLPNIVLIHGAWADGSAWDAVIQRLQADGFHVTAPQLPMSSLGADVARVRQVLVAQSGPTLLVAHSFGGAVITALGADAPHVVGLVYESAFAPDERETMNGLINGGPQPAGAAAIRPDAQGYLWLDPDGFVRFFAPDVNPVQARVMSAVQQPVAASEFMGDDAFGTPSWKSLPSWYLVTENDQMVPPAVQHFFAQRMGAKTTSVAGSHASMVSHPDEVTAFIVQAAQAAAASATVAAS
jgi:pimeloyl-ACP methyl ester carboxylesterase